METKGRMAAMPAAGWRAVVVLALVALAGCGGGVNENLTGQNTTPGSGPGGSTTPTVEGLSIAPAAVTLFAGLGVPPLACTGSVQSFVVTGDAPPFTLAANGGCLSTTTLAGSGDTFTFTAGNAIGNSSIIVTDALGDTATASVTVRNANAAFLKVDVVPSQRSDNGDGTFTSIVGALLTDAVGVVVGGGVPVEFTLAEPVAGVSLTSPGYTNQSAPCTGAVAVAQPGDALSCIKYAQSLQGATVTIHARVQTAGAGVLEDERTVTLPVSGVTPVPTTIPTPGQPAAIQFLGAQPPTIGVRGSGLPQQSQMTFQVTDARGVPVEGVAVSFSVSTVADESIDPDSGVTDASGNVGLTLTAGERAVSVQIKAEVDSVTPALSVTSTPVDILGAPASQPAFSLAHQFHNISGRVTFGLQDQITAFVGDRFGNPVPPGTAVSFTTNGGVIGGPIATNALGQAVGTLVSQNPLPSKGIVDTLATTHGERPFDDANHNGVCDAGETLQPLSEPFYDANCNQVYDAGEDFIDLNGNHKFDADQGTGTPACGDAVVIFDNICTTFSGPTVVNLIPSSTGPLPAGGTRDYTLIIADPDGNPIVGGSTVNIAVTGRVKLLGPASFTLADVQTFGQILDGVNSFQFSITDTTPTAQLPETDSLTVAVTSAGLPAGGNGSVSVTDVITFLAAPTPTATALPTPTPTTLPPAIAPDHATLPKGSGAPPSGCNGGSQTFFVTGGSPPFMVSAGGGCLDVTSVPASGGTFTYRAGDTPASYSITVQDAVGRTASIGVIVEGPATPTVPPTPTVGSTATISATPTISPTTAPTATATIGAPAALQFIGADPSVIGVRGSGLPPQSTLTFRVTDAIGVALRGVSVSFSVSPIADETIAPDQAITDAGGNVHVTLTSGERALSVQITAQITSVTPPLTVRSTAVDILGAPPSQLHFGLAQEFHNIAGRVTFGLTDDIRAFVGDRFGNPVPAGTAVSFTTIGGVIGSPITTNELGQAVGTLVSQRPLPDKGLANTLATTHGERPFDDANHNGICDPGEAVQAVSEPYYDTNCNQAYDDGEEFIDLNGNGMFDTDQGTGAPACGDSVVIFENICTTFSANTIVQLIPSPPGPIPAGGIRDYTLIISDADGNPIVGGSTVNIAIQGRIKLLGPASFTLPDTQTFGQIIEGLNSFHFSITDNEPTSTASETDALIVTVTSGPESLPAGGNGSVITTDQVTFLPVIPATPIPTPTPTGTVPPLPGTATATPTVTPTPTPPALHIHLSLFTLASPNRDGTMEAAISALVTDSDGVVVGDGAIVRFSVVGTPDLPVGVSVTSPGVTGGPPPCALCYLVPAQPGDAVSCVKYDAALGDGKHTVTIEAVIDTPSGPLQDIEDIVLPQTTFVCPV